MAEKRMFTNKIVNSDPFKELPLSAQALYFHLGMNADDEGFLNNAKSVQRSICASDDDMKLLIAKKFIIPFETGVIVIKHWKMHNTIAPSRMKPTQYIDEKNQLGIKENNAYTLILNTNCKQTVSTCMQIADDCIQNVDKLQTDECSVDEKKQQGDEGNTAYLLGLNGVQTNCKQMPTNCRQIEGRCLPSVEEIRLEEIRRERGESRGADAPSPTPTPNITYEYLINTYGKVFVDERIQRAKKYSKTNLETVAKWCEEDSKKQAANKFNNFHQRPYDAEAMERILLSQNQHKASDDP